MRHRCYFVLNLQLDSSLRLWRPLGGRQEQSCPKSVYTLVYGPDVALRSKIIYFNDVTIDKFGKSVFSLSEKEQALCLIHELEHFSLRHY